jgi:hypothetical protein
MSALGSNPGLGTPGADPNRPTAGGASSEKPTDPGSTGHPAWIAATIVLIAAVVGHFVIVGDDARWLAALGHVVLRDHAVPTGVPFASASTVHWPNTLVLAEVIFYALERALGDQGLLVAQTLAAGMALTILAWGGGAPRPRAPPTPTPAKR